MGPVRDVQIADDEDKNHDDKRSGWQSKMQYLLQRQKANKKVTNLGWLS